REHYYDLEEMAFRFKKIEDLLKQSLVKERPKDINISANDQDVKIKEEPLDSDLHKENELITKSMDTPPGLIPVRTITYGEESIAIPYFLRDAFLLPQRFEESERFLVRLGGEEEARLMSELPNSLEGFHKRVTRYSESHSQTFFNELRAFIDEEIRRRKLMQSRPGELFLFYQSSEIIVTEDLGNI